VKRGARPISSAGRTPRARRRRLAGALEPRLLALLLAWVLALSSGVLAQTQSDSGASGSASGSGNGTTPSGPGTAGPSSTGPASPGPSSAGSGQAATTTVPTPKIGVTVEASGGPSSLPDDVTAAIDAWHRAAAALVDVTVEPSAPSTIRYAPPALLGPDTLSLDLRTPGRSGLDIQVSPTAVKDHPMVLLHEIGVLLGLPEGSGDVMAYAVPSSGEPDAPSTTDVTNLRTQRTYAPEDLNHDGTVDFYDLVRFGQAFGDQGVNLPADFNHDGRVDNQDLALLRKAYAFTPPSQTAPTGTPGGSAGQGAGSSSVPGGGAAATGGASAGGGASSSTPGSNASPPASGGGTSGDKSP